METRLTPICSANSRSGGRRSPTFTLPSEISLFN